MRKFFPLLLVCAALTVPFVTFAAGTFTGSIVPTECNCPNVAGWGCALEVLQQLVNFIIYLGIMGCVAAVAYAGFTWLTAPTNPEARSKGRSILLNAFVGFIIVLASWLIINTFFTVLTTMTLSSATSQIIGSSSGKCLPLAVDVPGNGYGNQTLPGSNPSGTNPSGTTPTGQTPAPGTGNPNVDPNVQNGINTLDQNAANSSQGKCAYEVRQALAAEGYTDFNTNHPVAAQDYGPYLTNDGFNTVTNGTAPQAGDVAVYGAVPGHPYGHIEMYDGNQWVSDFKQNSMVPGSAYQNSTPTIYRPPSKTG